MLKNGNILSVRYGGAHGCRCRSCSSNIAGPLSLNISDARVGCYDRSPCGKPCSESDAVAAAASCCGGGVCAIIWR